MVVRYVFDMDRAFDFHEKGLGLSPIAKSAGWSMLSCGDAVVGLHAIYAGVSERPVAYAGLNLEVDDLDAAVGRDTACGQQIDVPFHGNAPFGPALAIDTAITSPDRLSHPQKPILARGHLIGRTAFPPGRPFATSAFGS